MLGPEGRKQLRQASKVATIGIEMGLSVGVGLLGGRWLDGYFDTDPVLTFVGLFFGIAAGFKRLFTLAKQYQAKSNSDSDSGSTPDSKQDD